MAERFYWELEATKPAKRARQKISDRRHDWSEAEVFSKLERVFPATSYLVLPQVRLPVPGAPDRTVDALVVSPFKSRGLWIAGVEIKISRSDWVKEARDAAKAELFMRYCRFWYLAQPHGVVPDGEVPVPWGVITVRKDGATITKPAVGLECISPDLDLMAAVARAIIRGQTTEGQSAEQAV